MSKSLQARLEHIAHSAKLIAGYIKGVSKQRFFEDVGIQDKVIRRLAIIGEAVKALPNDFRVKHNGIPWKEIAGMRDVLVHEYYDVDTALVWRVSKIQLPKLCKYVLGLQEKNLKPKK